MSDFVLSLPEQRDAERAKALGAFYTDSQIAEFLVWWAVRTPGETVIDPCFGGGVFLRCACKRLASLGGDPPNQVFGVELDPIAFRTVSDKLCDEFCLRKRNLVLSDIFEIEPDHLQQFESVVGNPPFIRYQRFAGDSRSRALKRALQQNVNLSQLSSSWAPFLVHVTSLLGNGGRLGLVMPMEVGHASYAKPVLEYLRRVFESVTFLTFRKKLFPDLSENTLLLLAENKGGGPARFYLRDLLHSGQLARIQAQQGFRIPGTRLLDADKVSEGNHRIVENLIPKKARDLYRELKHSTLTRPLGMLADVGVGYVTGANSFFHLDRGRIAKWAIPRHYLRAAVFRSRAFSGLRFTRNDWGKALYNGDAGYLLSLESEADLPTSVRNYVNFGEQQGFSRSFKCRSRSPWFRVPHVNKPDAFLTYMSGAMPRLVANDAGAVASNTLHVVRLFADWGLAGPELAALWQTSLTGLSAEIEGHGLGGGMLKLEPREAENVLLPVSDRDPHSLKRLAVELDSLARLEKNDCVQEQADNTILIGLLGLSKRECQLLQDAAAVLRARRYSRSQSS